MLEFAAEESLGGVLDRAQLVAEPLRSEQRDSRLGIFQSPTLPYQPQVKIQSPRSMSETGDGFSFHWDAVLVNLLMERFAEVDDILTVAEMRVLRG